MTDKEALDFLAYKMGNRDVRTAEALGVSPQVLGNWRKRGTISHAKRAAVWALVNDHGGNLSREWLLATPSKQGEAA